MRIGWASKTAACWSSPTRAASCALRSGSSPATWIRPSLFTSAMDARTPAGPALASALTPTACAPLPPCGRTWAWTCTRFPDPTPSPAPRWITCSTPAATSFIKAISPITARIRPPCTKARKRRPARCHSWRVLEVAPHVLVGVDGDGRHVGAGRKLEDGVRAQRPEPLVRALHGDAFHTDGRRFVELQREVGRTEIVNQPVSQRSAGGEEIGRAHV